MKAVLALSLSFAVIAGGPVLARETQDRPVASARLITPTKDAHRWHGVGDVISKVQLCVTSNTGRFRLRLDALSILSPLSTMPEFEVAFTTSAGQRTVQTWDSGGELNFGGEVRGDCGAMGNVALEFRIRQRSLTAAVAGDYLNQIRYSVEPA